MAGDTELQQLAKTDRNPIQEPRYQELLRQARESGGGTSGGGAPAGVPFDADAFLRQSRAEGEALRTKQAAEEEALFQTFQTKATAQPKLTDIYSGLLTEQGIPGLQKSVTTVTGEIANIKDLIDRLEQDVTARTSGTLTTEAQRRRQIAAEREPLSSSLGRLATGLTPTVEALKTAREDVGTRLSLTSAEQTKELEPDRMRIAVVSDRFARETTGYTQDRQDSLSLLLQKIQRDQALSDREWAAAQDLAKSEKEWENTKKQLEIQSVNAIKLKQTLEPKAGVGTIVNPYLTPGVTTPLGGGKTQKDWNNLGNQSMIWSNFSNIG